MLNKISRILIIVFLKGMRIDQYCRTCLCLNSVAYSMADDMCVDCWDTEREYHDHYLSEMDDSPNQLTFEEWQYQVEHCDDEYLRQQSIIRRAKRSLNLGLFFLVPILVAAYWLP